jgi:hypothetical protein
VSSGGLPREVAFSRTEEEGWLYIAFILLSMVAVAAGIVLAFSLRGYNALLLHIEIFFALWAIFYTALPALAAGLPVWIAARLIAARMGLTRAKAATVSSIPTLYAGVLMFWIWMMPEAFAPANIRRCLGIDIGFCSSMFGGGVLVTMQLIGATVAGPLIAAWLFREREEADWHG